MAHRHPSKLNAEYVTHPAARRLLRAELANCAECRAHGDSEALADLEPAGIFDSLLRGFATHQAEKWRPPRHRYPTVLMELAPPKEVRFLNIVTRNVVRRCVIRNRQGDPDTGDALSEVSNLEEHQRSAVLDDIVDGLLEDEA